MTVGMTGGSECDEGSAAASLVAARALIAREMTEANEPPLTLGEITLRPHQRQAVRRLTRLLRAHGGALLADATGLGKTFVALAVARHFERILIVCPAALRDLWLKSLVRVGRDAPIVSFERLSRAAYSLADGPELVIVDESHHLRNRETRRYDAVASLCDRAGVLLLSATPVQNRPDDLGAQLALFLGDAVHAMSDVELARFVVRRDADVSAARLPFVVGPRWIELLADDDVLDDLERLPPALPLADEGDAHALLRYTLLRQWSSSRAALVAGLRGRLARGVALLAALEAGRRPTRRELSAWSHTEDAVQLALPELLIPSGSASDRALVDAVERHATAVRALLRRLRAMPDPDIARAEALSALRCRHADARIIAFSQYAQTVRSISRLLISREQGVAELTARGGRVAGGRMARHEMLAQLAPSSPPVPRAERIDLLVTTDVSSEGLDLQLASVVVHLDLPWNPARLEQRVGRVRRLGARHERVFVYALAPPARSERVLAVETRLREKIRIAARLVGVGSASLPDVGVEPDASAPALTSELYALIEHWRGADSSVVERHRTTPVVAAVRARVRGFFALVADGDERLLVADEGSGATDDPRVLRRVASLTDGEPTIGPAAHVSQSIAAITDWCQRRGTRKRICILGPEGTRLRVRITARIAGVLANTPRHARVVLAATASAAGDSLRVPLGIAAERRLTQLADAPAADESWLRQLSELGAGRAAHEMHEARVLALIVLDGGRA